MTRAVRLALACALVVAAPRLATAQTPPAPSTPPPDDGGDGSLGLPDDDTATPPADATPAPADDPSLAPKLADAAAKFEKKGDKLRKRKKTADAAAAEYQRALDAYQKANELAPSAAYLVAIAGLDAKLGRPVDAAKSYQLALTGAPGAPLDDAAKTRAQAALDTLMSGLGLVTLTIEPDGAEVSVDGADAGKTPLTQPIVLAPGEHTLALHADGYVDFQTRLQVEAGSESDRRFELKPASSPAVVEPPVEPPPPVAPPPPPSHPSRLLLYAGAGLTVALAGTATTTGLLALSWHSTFVDPKTSAAERKKAQSSGRTYAHVTDGLTIAAVLVAGATVYDYLFVYRKAKRGNEPRMVLAPAVDAGAAGLVLAGRI